MVRRDYLLRVIEQLGVAWGGVLRLAGLRQGGQYEETGQAIDQLSRQYLGLNAGSLRTLSADELIGLVRLGSTIGAGDAATAEKLLLLGALLREDAELQAAQADDDGAAASGLKALQVYLTVVVEEGVRDDRALDAIGPLRERLTAYELPLAIRDLLWRFHEGVGDFASAEDELFTLLDDDPELLPEGLAFYERLLTLPDETLAAGNLPRDEVLAGQAELREREAD